MRLLAPILLTLAAFALGACGEEELPRPNAAAGEAKAKTGLTIKTDGNPLPVQKGKIAVLPDEVGPATPPPAAAQAPAPAAPEVAPPPAAEPEQAAAAEPDRDGRWFEEPQFGGRGGDPERWAEREDLPPSPRDCRRAARRGDPLADTGFCRDILGWQSDRALVEDCIAADRAGDAFADSRACRRALAN